jgi:hypothetical protein
MDKNHYTKFPSVNSKKNNVRIKKIYSAYLTCQITDKISIENFKKIKIQ